MTEFPHPPPENTSSEADIQAGLDIVNEAMDQKELGQSRDPKELAKKWKEVRDKWQGDDKRRRHLDTMAYFLDQNDHTKADPGQLEKRYAELEREVKKLEGQQPGQNATVDENAAPSSQAQAAEQVNNKARDERKEVEAELKQKWLAGNPGKDWFSDEALDYRNGPYKGRIGSDPFPGKSWLDVEIDRRLEERRKARAATPVQAPTSAPAQASRANVEPQPAIPPAPAGEQADEVDATPEHYSLTEIDTALDSYVETIKGLNLDNEEEQELVNTHIVGNELRDAVVKLSRGEEVSPEDIRKAKIGAEQMRLFVQKAEELKRKQQSNTGPAVPTPQPTITQGLPPMEYALEPSSEPEEEQTPPQPEYTSEEIRNIYETYTKYTNQLNHKVQAEKALLAAYPISSEQLKASFEVAVGRVYDPEIIKNAIAAAKQMAKFNNKLQELRKPQPNESAEQRNQRINAAVSAAMGEIKEAREGRYQTPSAKLEEAAEMYIASLESSTRPSILRMPRLTRDARKADREAMEEEIKVDREARKKAKEKFEGLLTEYATATNQSRETILDQHPGPIARALKAMGTKDILDQERKRTVVKNPLEDEIAPPTEKASLLDFYNLRTKYSDELVKLVKAGDRKKATKLEALPIDLIKRAEVSNDYRVSEEAQKAYVQVEQGIEKVLTGEPDAIEVELQQLSGAAQRLIEQYNEQLRTNPGGQGEAVRRSLEEFKRMVEDYIDRLNQGLPLAQRQNEITAKLRRGRELSQQQLQRLRAEGQRLAAAGNQRAKELREQQLNRLAPFLRNIFNRRPFRGQHDQQQQNERQGTQVTDREDDEGVSEEQIRNAAEGFQQAVISQIRREIPGFDPNNLSGLSDREIERANEIGAREWGILKDADSVFAERILTNFPDVRAFDSLLAEQRHRDLADLTASLLDDEPDDTDVSREREAALRQELERNENSMSASDIQTALDQAEVFFSKFQSIKEVETIRRVVISIDNFVNSLSQEYRDTWRNAREFTEDVQRKLAAIYKTPQWEKIERLVEDYQPENGTAEDESRQDVSPESLKRVQNMAQPYLDGDFSLSQEDLAKFKEAVALSDAEKAAVDAVREYSGDVKKEERIIASQVYNRIMDALTDARSKIIEPDVETGTDEQIDDLDNLSEAEYEMLDIHYKDYLNNLHFDLRPLQAQILFDSYPKPGSDEERAFIKARDNFDQVTADEKALAAQVYSRIWKAIDEVDRLQSNYRVNLTRAGEASSNENANQPGVEFSVDQLNEAHEQVKKAIRDRLDAELPDLKSGTLTTEQEAKINSIHADEWGKLKEQNPVLAERLLKDKNEEVTQFEYAWQKREEARSAGTRASSSIQAEGVPPVGLPAKESEVSSEATLTKEDYTNLLNALGEAYGDQDKPHPSNPERQKAVQGIQTSTEEFQALLGAAFADRVSKKQQELAAETYKEIKAILDRFESSEAKPAAITESDKEAQVASEENLPTFEEITNFVGKTLEIKTRLGPGTPATKKYNELLTLPREDMNLMYDIYSGKNKSQTPEIRERLAQTYKMASQMVKEVEELMSQAPKTSELEASDAITEPEPTPLQYDELYDEYVKERNQAETYDADLEALISLAPNLDLLQFGKSPIATEDEKRQAKEAYKKIQEGLEVYRNRPRG